MEGNLCFKIDWVSLIVGRKFTVFRVQRKSVLQLAIQAYME